MVEETRRERGNNVGERGSPFSKGCVVELLDSAMTKKMGELRRARLVIDD